MKFRNKMITFTVAALITIVSIGATAGASTKKVCEKSIKVYRMVSDPGTDGPIMP